MLAAEPADTRIAQLRATVLQALTDIAHRPEWDRTRACVILSGGLDSSIVACLGQEALGLAAAITVLASPDATDRPHATAMAAAAGLAAHHQLEISLEEALQELPDAVRVLQSFDPMALRNEIAVCRALRHAAALGFTCAVTGDGADELFGGYSFTHRLDNAAWEESRSKMARLMRFGSVPLGRHFGLHVVSPFTQPAVVAAAMQFGKADCVQPAPQQATAPADGQGQVAGAQAATSAQAAQVPLLGKMPLRLAFPEVPVCWRVKDPIEVGCGTTELGDRPWLPGAPAGYFSSRISDEAFESERRAAAAEGVTIRDKEHLAYWREFRRQFPDGEVPGKPRASAADDPCPACSYQLSHPEQVFCVTCGHYDAQLRSAASA